MDSLSNFEKSNMRAYSDLGVFFNLGGKETLFRDVTNMLNKNNPPEKMETLIKVAKVVAFIALNIITVLMYVIYKAVEKSASATAHKVEEQQHSPQLNKQLPVENSAQDSLEKSNSNNLLIKEQVTAHKVEATGMNSEFQEQIEKEPLITRTDKEMIDFTKDRSITDQRFYDTNAQNLLKAQIGALNGSCEYISAPQSKPVNYNDVSIGKLDEDTFSVDYAPTVQNQMGKDAGDKDLIAVYGVASQFNGAESRGTTPVAIGQAESEYRKDPTQGPGAQRMYPVEQVEIINRALYMGRNSIANVLDNSTKHTLKGGYLMPATEKDAAAVIEQFKNNGHNLLSTCIGNKLREAKEKEQTGERTEKVYMVLSAAPALGAYLRMVPIEAGEVRTTKGQEAELSFHVTLCEYRSLFEHGLRLAQQNEGKQVVIKPCALGLGAFENPPEAVAKAYYQAASEYSDKLTKANIKVKLQIRPTNESPAEKMAIMLKFPAFKQPQTTGGGSK